MSFAAMILVGCLLDVAFGWPDPLYRRIGHPVTWIGALISWLEAALNAGSERERFWNGAFASGLVIVLTGFFAFGLQALLPSGVLGILFGGVLVWPWLALRSMHTHVDAVAQPLLREDLDAARGAVAMIVGRDPKQLDERGVARAALESLAENTSDGIVAPVFWGVIGGLPGVAVYKAINTLDSMIGHRNDRYEQFGKVAARVDDLVNLIPARLSGGLFAGVSAHAGRAFRVMFRDARAHRSPNAGWPEAAMAGALNVRLSGPRVYETRIAQEPWLNETAPDPCAEDLARGLALYRRAMGAMMLGLAVLAVLWM